MKCLIDQKSCQKIQLLQSNNIYKDEVIHKFYKKLHPNKL